VPIVEEEEEEEEEEDEGRGGEEEEEEIKTVYGFLNLSCVQTLSCSNNRAAYCSDGA